MSDVLIKGMKMPKECEYCMFAGLGGAENEYYVCMFNGKWKDRDNHGRMESCPLVEIPTHGELIEKEELLAELELEWNACNDDTEFANKIVPNCIKDAPVIIESEEE